MSTTRSSKRQRQPDIRVGRKGNSAASGSPTACPKELEQLTLSGPRRELALLADPVLDPCETAATMSRASS
jgi:hypothetical protein